MVAAKRDLFIEQGATFTFVFRWMKQFELEEPVPVDLTGYKARMQIRKSQGTPVFIEATTENSFITVEDALDGKVKLYLPALETDKLTTSPLVYDVEMVEPNGDVHRVLKGKVTVDPNITQESTDPGGG